MVHDHYRMMELWGQATMRAVIQVIQLHRTFHDRGLDVHRVTIPSLHLNTFHRLWTTTSMDILLNTFP